MTNHPVSRNEFEAWKGTIRNNLSLIQGTLNTVNNVNKQVNINKKAWIQNGKDININQNAIRTNSDNLVDLGLKLKAKVFPKGLQDQINEAKTHRDSIESKVETLFTKKSDISHGHAGDDIINTLKGFALGGGTASIILIGVGAYFVLRNKAITRILK
jgi:hypothetical protein